MDYALNNLNFCTFLQLWSKSFQQMYKPMLPSQPSVCSCLDLSISLRAIPTGFDFKKKRRKASPHSGIFRKKNPANGKYLTMFAFIFSLACSAELNLLLQLDKRQDKLYVCLRLFKEREQRFQNQPWKMELFFSLFTNI